MYCRDTYSIDYQWRSEDYLKSEWTLSHWQIVLAFVTMKSSFKTDRMKATEKRYFENNQTPRTQQNKQKPHCLTFPRYRKNEQETLTMNFFQYFIGDAAVHGLITFFIPANSSFSEEAFVYACYIMIYFCIMIYFQTTLSYKSIRCHKLNSYL